LEALGLEAGFDDVEGRRAERRDRAGDAAGTQQRVDRNTFAAVVRSPARLEILVHGDGHRAVGRVHCERRRKRAVQSGETAFGSDVSETVDEGLVIPQLEALLRDVGGRHDDVVAYGGDTAGETVDQDVVAAGFADGLERTEVHGVGRHARRRHRAHAAPQPRAAASHELLRRAEAEHVGRFLLDAARALAL